MGEKVDYGNRTNKFVRHHILARHRNGERTINNLIRLENNREKAFHLLFGTRTFKEAALILIRAEKMIKGRR